MSTKELNMDYLKKLSKSKVNASVIVLAIVEVIFAIALLVVIINGSKPAEPFNPFETRTGKAYVDTWICEGPFASSSDNEYYYMAFTEYDEPFVIMVKGSNCPVPVYGEDCDESSLPEEVITISGTQKELERDLIPFAVDWLSYSYDGITTYNYDEYIGDYMLDLSDSGVDYMAVIILLVLMVIFGIIIWSTMGTNKKNFNASIAKMKADGSYAKAESELKFSHPVEYKRLATILTDESVIYTNNGFVGRIAYADILNAYGSNIINNKYDYEKKCIVVEEKDNFNQDKFFINSFASEKRDTKKTDFDELLKKIKSNAEIARAYAGSSKATAEATQETVADTATDEAENTVNETDGFAGQAAENVNSEEA